MTRLLIIGGSDAGVSAALRAKEVDETAQVTVIVADTFVNYSICGLPFYLSGEVPDWHALAHRTTAEIERAGVHILLKHRVQVIDPANNMVQVIDAEEQQQQLSYDRLIIATGAIPVRPAITGLDLPGVFLLRSMDDGLTIGKQLSDTAQGSAVIIGGGYIGLEMAEALTLRGYTVTVVEHHPTLLKTVDPSLSQLIETELRRHNVEVVTGVSVKGIARYGTQLQISGTQEFSRKTDLVLVAVGVQPSTDLAHTSNIKIGRHGAISVTPFMETNVPDIYAAGDCVETHHRLLATPTYLPLGTTAHKQGRIAGENAAGGHRAFAGSLGTQVVKVFDLAIGRTGLSEREAQEAGYSPLSVASLEWDHKQYYPEAHHLHIRMTGDRRTGQLLGAQIAGDYRAEVAKRIDIFATALFHRMRVEDLQALDLSYTPPFGSPWDAVQMSAQNWARRFLKTLASSEG